MKTILFILSLLMFIDVLIMVGYNIIEKNIESIISYTVSAIFIILVGSLVFITWKELKQTL